MYNLIKVLDFLTTLQGVDDLVLISTFEFISAEVVPSTPHYQSGECQINDSWERRRRKKREGAVIGRRRASFKKNNIFSRWLVEWVRCLHFYENNKNCSYNLSWTWLFVNGFKVQNKMYSKVTSIILQFYIFYTERGRWYIQNKVSFIIVNGLFYSCTLELTGLR